MALCILMVICTIVNIYKANYILACVTGILAILNLIMSKTD